MVIDFSFKGVQDEKDLQRLVSFLMKQPLNYPRYEDWVQRAESEIDLGYKKAILAFSCGYLVGDLIYQPHKELTRIREIKNVRIHPSIRNRYFASFMLRQAECENREEFDAVIVDIRDGREDINNLFMHAGYRKLASVNLYDPNILDIIFIKIFNGKDKSLYTLQNLFSN